MHYKKLKKEGKNFWYKENKTIIISLVFLIIILFIYFLYQDEIFMSPNYNSIGSFLSALGSSSAGYKIVIPDQISQEEQGIIEMFSQRFVISDFINDSDYNLENSRIIVGLFDEFQILPYKEYMRTNDVIVAFSSDKNCLYIYSKNLGNLSLILEYLNNYDIHQESLSNFSIKLNSGIIEFLDLFPVAIARRYLPALILNTESVISVNFEVFENVENLLLAEITEGSKIISSDPTAEIIEDNLVSWIVHSAVPGNYSFNYSVVPTSNSVSFFGKLGLMSDSFETAYPVLGQSNVQISTFEGDPHYGSTGDSSGADSSDIIIPIIVNKSGDVIYLTVAQLNNGAIVELDKSIKVIFKLSDLSEEYSLLLSGINSDICSFLIENRNININLALDQSAKLSLQDNKINDLYIKIEKINNGKCAIMLKKIIEDSLDSFDIENPIKNAITGSIIKILIVIFLIVCIGIMIVFAIRFYSSKKNKTKKQISGDTRINQAKNIAIQYKKAGYSDEKIRQIFKGRGWSNSDINQIIG